jgi:glucosamine-6-phosphate deaminase
MRILIKKDKEEVGRCVADYLINKVNAFKPTKLKPFVLGLPTGS